MKTRMVRFLTLSLAVAITFAGQAAIADILTFKNGQNIRDTLAETPPDKFMLETDSPFMAPVPPMPMSWPDRMASVTPHSMTDTMARTLAP